MSIDRRRFIRALGEQALRSVGTALTMGAEVQRQVNDLLREGDPVTLASDVEPVTGVDRPMSSGTDEADAGLPDGLSPGTWADEPPPSSWLTAAGTLEVLDQRALPGSSTTIEAESVGEVVQLIRAGALDGGLALAVTAIQSLAMATMRAGDAPDLAMLSVQQGAARALAAARPDIPLIAGALERAMAPPTPGDDAPISADMLRRFADTLAARHRAEHVRVALEGAAWLRRRFGDRAEILLTGESSDPAATATIGTTRALLHAAVEAGMAIKVWVPEGSPQGRSATLLTAGSPAGLVVRPLANVDVGRLLDDGRIGAVLMGSAWVSAEGDLAGERGFACPGTARAMKPGST